MNNVIISVLCLLWILVSSGCTHCERYVKYQRNEIEGINVPLEIGNTKIPINIGKVKLSENMREASELIQILDNGQYRDCQVIERLPKDQQAQFTRTILEYNQRMDIVAAILTRTLTTTAIDDVLTEWLRKDKK